MRPTLLRGLGARAACILPALCITCAAQADLITLSADGPFEITETTGTNQTIAMDLAVTDQTGGFGFIDMALELVREFEDPGPDTMTGAFVLYGATPEDFLSATFAGSWHVNPDIPTLSSYAGSWVSTDAGGAYASLFGTGSLGGVSILMDEFTGTASLLLTGDLVPAAPGLALLGIGFAAGARRRRS